MKLFKKWSDWVDICIREDSKGTHYLLQMRTREDGKKQFKNRRMDHDDIPGYLLFHGNYHEYTKVVNTPQSHS